MYFYLLIIKMFLRKYRLGKPHQLAARAYLLTSPTCPKVNYLHASGLIISK